MTLTIEITPELKRQLQQAAEKAGLSLNDYVLELLSQTQPPQPDARNQLSQTEADLIRAINHSLSNAEWQRYYALIDKRQAETLTPDEQDALIALSDKLEAINVNRIQAVADLARLRNTSINKLMAELGLKPLAHA
jgi:DNA-binding MurR/RpiR family transcriptional regulator